MTSDTAVDQRATLLAAASELLAEAGPGALSVRRIAAKAGCSTMGVYTNFGGKDGVIEALYVDGFAFLRERLEALPQTGDPVDALRTGCAAYRAMALEHPTYYSVMFDRPLPDWVPPTACKLHGLATLAILERGVQRAVEAGRVQGDVDAIAHSIWATCHGLVSLELSGLGRDAGRYQLIFDRTIDTLLRGFEQAEPETNDGR